MMIVAPCREATDMPSRGPPDASAADQEPTGFERLHLPRPPIPAVTHVDWSARLQTVDAVRNRRLHALLSAFREQTGCSVLVNTSFNVRGEPIVCSPREAWECFLATDMDALVIENCLLLKAAQSARSTDRDAHLARFDKD
jgi:carbamoyltransferase